MGVGVNGRWVGGGRVTVGGWLGEGVIFENFTARSPIKENDCCNFNFLYMHLFFVSVLILFPLFV